MTSQKTQFTTEKIFSKRDYFLVGNSAVVTPYIYRGVLILSPKDEIAQSLMTVDGYTTDMNYSINQATLKLTAKNGAIDTPLYAFMMPLDQMPDESVTWYAPSVNAPYTFDNSGGDIEPRSEGINVRGVWNKNTVSFDITPFINIWSGGTYSNIGIIITNTEGEEYYQKSLTAFYSAEAVTPLIGGAPLTNCNFLGAGAANFTSTEGIRVRFTTNGNSVLLQSLETDPNDSVQWSAFNAALSVGSTFSMSMPDVNLPPNFSEKVTVSGSSFVFTVVDKLSYNGSPSIVIDEYASVFQSDFYTTGEFSCNSQLPTGTGILELTNTDTNLKLYLKNLNTNSLLDVNYTPNNTPNNVRSYTLKFYSDETIKNGRVRLYLNEAAVTENRNGLYTEIKSEGVQPRLNMVVQPVPFTKTS